jgi:hypothetical protein
MTAAFKRRPPTDEARRFGAALLAGPAGTGRRFLPALAARSLAAVLARSPVALPRRLRSPLAPGILVQLRTRCHGLLAQCSGRPSNLTRACVSSRVEQREGFV